MSAPSPGQVDQKAGEYYALKEALDKATTAAAEARTPLPGRHSYAEAGIVLARLTIP